MVFFNKTFLLDSLERAIKTIAQTLLSLWAVGEGFDLFNVNWKHGFSVAAGAGVISLLTSIVSAQVGDTKSASLVVETKGVK